ncbi:MAG: DUF1080 domain-containing protein [Sedimentisphaerales bacterium]|nr:DUF1080 domain-containing protein [Sedimentisphaerales bacterium]
MSLRNFRVSLSMFVLVVFALLSSTLSAATVLHWNFEDGTPGTEAYGTYFGRVGSLDLSGNGYGFYAWNADNGPSFSALGNSPDGQGMSVVFDGTEDGYQQSADFIAWSPEVWTIEISFKLDVAGSLKTLIGKDGSAGLSDSRLAAFYLQADGAGSIKLQYATVSGELLELVTGYVPQAGQWYNLVVRCNGDMVDINIDAMDGNGFVEIGSYDIDALGFGDVDHSFVATGVWTFGRGWYNNGNTDFIVGAIDDVRFSDSFVAMNDLLWYVPVQISETQSRTVLYTTDLAHTDDYYISLLQQPQADVAVTVVVPEGIDAGNGSGEPVVVNFTPANWNISRKVTLSIADAGYDFAAYELVSHSVTSADPSYADKRVGSVKAYVFDDSCGVWGYLGSDYNFDCTIDLADFSVLAALWMAAEKPFALDELAGDWLSNTMSYEQDNFTRSIQVADDPFYINTGNVVNTIHPFVYGQFYEHIYHSANGGLWGELVWNRSFEMNNGTGGGVWTIENGNELVQSSNSTNVILNFGDKSWSQYELTMEARKDSGSEGFLIEFLSDDNNYYWLNLGGWNNTQHAIEKAINGSRSNVSTVSGSMNTGQWYTVRIRCENNNISVWIDDEQLFDFTDSSIYTAGYVGVGTWSTQSRYRNISVTDLSDSSELFAGVPALPYSQSVVDFWQSFGNVTTSWNATEAVNDDYSISLVTATGDSGIIQDNFKFIGQNYTGSFWAKGSVAAGLAVEFLDGDTVIGQDIIGAVASGWSEYAYSIIPSAATDSGSLRIRLLGPGSLMLDQVSLMGQDSLATGGYRPDLLEAVNDLRAPIIRWPGGCYASAYFWKDGIGAQVDRHKFPIYLWEDQDTNSYGTDEFLRMCEMYDIEPLLVINIGILNMTCGVSIPYKLTPEQYMQDALDWMEYCNGDITTTWGAVRAANGHPEPYNVEYWEIDNETWQAGATAYADLAVEYAVALRAKAQELNFPIKLIACGGGDMNISGWNTTVINTCAALVDYISVHRYESPSAFKSGPLAYENFLVGMSNLIANSANPNLQIYMSEWNAQSIDWRTGLHCGALLNVFERQGSYFTLGGPALFLRHVSAGDWNNAFINFDHTGYFVAPNYIIMKLWWDHFAPNRLEMTGGDADINSVATLSADGQTLYIKMVNADPEAKSLAFTVDSSFVPGKCFMEYVASDDIYAANSLADKNLIQVQAKVLGADDQTIRFIAPAYSAGVITVKRAE